MYRDAAFVPTRGAAASLTPRDHERRFDAIFAQSGADIRLL
jgi:hypothetical protein